MCTRYVLREEHYEAVLRRLGIVPPPYSSRYNIAPGSAVPAVRRKPEDGTLEPVRLHWGLIPSWSKTANQKLVNARAESLADKPSFRDALRSRRCLIPASGFYEWKTVGRTKQPWLFRRTDQTPFAFAGLWDNWRSPEGEERQTCAVITTAPNALMQPIHHRMPLVLTWKKSCEWLNPARREPADLASLLEPWSASTMTAVVVHSRVNNVRHDAPDCLELATGSDSNDAPQFSLEF